MRTITSRKNPLVQSYRAALHDARDAILLEGVHLIQEALAARVPIRSAAFSPTLVDRDPVAARLAHDLEGTGTDVMSVPDAVLGAMSPVATPSGAVALADRPAPRVDELSSGIVVVAVDVQDPGNMGALVRTAEAAGVAALIASPGCADPFGWKALRASMGSAFRLPIVRDQAGPPLDDVVTRLRARGFRTVATVARNGTPLYDTDLRPPVAVLVGSEGSGLPSTLVDASDVQVTIPMRGRVESLNAAVASAIVLFECVRQSALRSGAGEQRER